MRTSSLPSIFLTFCLIFVAACQNSNDKSMSAEPPIAIKKPTTLEKHGHERVDNYYWLNQREDQEVLDYLSAENEYYAEMTKHTTDFQQELFEEMKGRIKEDDSSVPYKLNGYWYNTRYETGKEYPIYARKKEVLRLKKNCFLIAMSLPRDTISSI